MSGIILHPHTREQLRSFLDLPSHAVLLAGPTGLGKTTAAMHLSERLLGLPSGAFSSHAYTMLLRPEDERAIGIDSIRRLEHFTTLKVPKASGSTPIARIAVVKDAHRLTEEAQNALLKILEEPPRDTVIILTASSDRLLLPTIRSRVQTIVVRKPEIELLIKHFSAEGRKDDDVRRAALMSGGLPAVMHTLLNDTNHPLAQATATARSILQASMFDRLRLVDDLSKHKEACQDILFVLQQMAGLSLANPQMTPRAAARWQQILSAAYDAADQLTVNAQPKLVLTNFMLKL